MLPLYCVNFCDLVLHTHMDSIYKFCNVTMCHEITQAKGHAKLKWLTVLALCKQRSSVYCYESADLHDPMADK